MHRFRSPAALAALALTPLAHATNGMNLDAYGAKAGAMGGAAMGYDSGNSAVMNNPATLGLRPEGASDFGAGITVMKPNVSSSHPMAGSAESDGNNYYMPSVSWMHRSGAFVYGAAMFAQGGMGTEYGSGSSLFAGGMSLTGSPAPMSGEEIRSEVGVGRVMLPLAWRATDALTVAAQVDYVWASMDLRMDIDGQTFGRLVADTPGLGSASGSLVSAFSGAMGAGMITDVDYARFDFSDSNRFTGSATAHGGAVKFGLHYRVSNRFALGAAYHSKTWLGDLTTGDRKATVQMGVVTPMTPPGEQTTVAMRGKIRVIDFQWPETFGVGMAWAPTEKLMLVADVKRIRWAEVMKDFKLRFEADADQGDPLAAALVASGGRRLDASLDQDWKDQTMFMFGVQYMVLPTLALRAGFSKADHPVPSRTLNPLFPAICEDHYTFGVGWRPGRGHSVAAAVSLAPRVEETNPNTGIRSSHSQTTIRLNYNYRF